MEISNYKCDICGIIECGSDYDNPLGWLTVGRSSKDQKSFWADRKDICPACAEKCGFVAAMAKAKESRDVEQRQNN